MPKTFLLDASAIIAEPSLDLNAKLITTGKILSELKSMETKGLALHALMTEQLEIREPKEERLKEIEALVSEKGFKTKLSVQDRELLALALQLSREKADLLVLTDDFSIQNFLAILKIPFESVHDKGIEKIMEFSLECIGCGKKYAFSDKLAGKCLHCGSRVRKKPEFREITG